MNKTELFDSNTNDSGENQAVFSSFYETELGRMYDKKKTNQGDGVTKIAP